MITLLTTMALTMEILAMTAQIAAALTTELQITVAQITADMEAVPEGGDYQISENVNIRYINISECLNV